MFRVALALLAVAAWCRPADACTPWRNAEHVIQAGQVPDTTAPSEVTARAGIMRVDGEDSCRLAWIAVDVAASDDLTSSDELGYRITVDDMPAGTLPRIPYAVDPLGGQLYLYFAYDAPSFTASLAIRAVDLQGNEGPTTTVAIEYARPPDESDGCSAGAHAGLPWLVGALAFVRRRRPRVGRRPARG